MQFLNGGLTRTETVELSRGNVLSQIELFLRNMGKLKDRDDVISFDIKEQADGNFIVSYKLREERTTVSIDLNNGQSET